MIKIFTDSSSYIPSDIQLEYGITVIPHIMKMGGRDIPETSITNESFYEQVKKANEIPKSSPLDPDVLYEAFLKEIEEGNSIVAVFVSKKVSETCKNAAIAKERILRELPKANISIVDSGSAAMEEGLAVLAAAEKAQEGAWLEEVVKAAESTIKYTKFLFMPSTTKFMEISGRISKVQSFFGDMLQITPILQRRNGSIELKEMVRIKTKAINRFLEIFKEDISKYGVQKVIVHHIDDIDKAMELTERIREIADTDISICDIGPSVGANVGPGTIGIVYMTQQEIPEESGEV